MTAGSIASLQSLAGARRILGVDPGTRRVGYGLLDPFAAPRKTVKLGQLPWSYVECGVIEAPEEAPVIDRIHVVAMTLAEIIAEFRPSVLALEKAYYGRNAASALKLGQARGAIMLIACQHQVPVVEYAPSQIKQIVVGNGRATKAEIQDRVRLLFRLRTVPQSDAADALAIALCHGQSVPWRR